MKTSVIEAHDMLSVLSVDEVEKRIGEVPGIESVTVDFAGGSATVRYDETRIKMADIKSAVRQRGYDSAAPGDASAGHDHEGHAGPRAPATPAPAAPKATPVAPATAGAAATGSAQQGKAAQSAPDAAAAPAAHAGHEQHDKPAPDKA